MADYNLRCFLRPNALHSQTRAEVALLTSPALNIYCVTFIHVLNANSLNGYTITQLVIN